MSNETSVRGTAINNLNLAMKMLQDTQNMITQANAMAADVPAVIAIGKLSKDIIPIMQAVAKLRGLE